MDAKTVIKAWEIFRDSNPYGICDGCEFRAIKEPEYCMGKMIEDTIAMLKEQEAVVPIRSYARDSMKICGIDFLYNCGSCKAEILKDDKFCHKCGKRIEWEVR